MDSVSQQVPTLLSVLQKVLILMVQRVEPFLNLTSCYQSVQQL